MAKTAEITYACGCRVGKTYRGKAADLATWLEAESRLTCAACEKAARQAEAEKAAAEKAAAEKAQEEAAMAGAAELVGTEAQVEYASKIRRSLLVHMAKIDDQRPYMAKPIADAISCMKAQVSAKWWLDRKDAWYEKLLYEVVVDLTCPAVDCSFYLDGLPALVGSEKQIQWAKDIRADALKSLARCMTYRQSKLEEKSLVKTAWLVVDTLKSMADAKWWIDRSGKDCCQLLGDSAVCRQAIADEATRDAWRKHVGLSCKQIGLQELCTRLHAAYWAAEAEAPQAEKE